MSRKEPSVNDVIRVGRVSAVYEERHTVKVDFADRGGGLVSKEISVCSVLTRKNHFYALPDVGEHVVCAFYGNGLSEGAVIGAIYDANNLPPIPDGDICSIVFEDETSLSYDRKNHRLAIDVCEGGSVEITAHGQAVTMSEDGTMSMKGPKVITIDAQERLVLRAPHIHTDSNSGSEGAYS